MTKQEFENYGWVYGTIVLFGTKKYEIFGVDFESNKVAINYYTSRSRDEVKEDDLIWIKYDQFEIVAE